MVGYNIGLPLFESLIGRERVTWEEEEGHRLCRVASDI